MTRALLCLGGFLFAFSASAVDFSLSKESIELLAAKSLLEFHFQPEFPKVGERVSLFVRLGTSFSRNEAVLDGILDGVPVKLEKTGGSLWAVHFKSFSEVKSHSFSVNISIRDEKQASRLRSGVNALKKQVKALEDAIILEDDLEKKAALERKRNEKIAYLDQLEGELENLKVFVKSEVFSFSVLSNPANADFPILLSASPNVTPLEKRIRIVLSGENFPSIPHVKFGGENGTVLSSTGSSIEVLAPSFGTQGPKEITVSFPAQNGEPKKNSILTNAFFATDQTIFKNLRPVAVTDGYLKVNLGEAAVLEAGQSYDENVGNQFSFGWEFKKVPTGSSFQPGATLPDLAQPQFVPDKKGIYTVECRLQETNTEELLKSLKSTVTIEVK